MLVSFCDNEVLFVKEGGKERTYSGLSFEGHEPGCVLVGWRGLGEAPVCLAVVLGQGLGSVQ